LPDCSGVALGVDRLIMLALGAERLSDVLAFSVDRA
ncbi:elongation factor P lysine(34) lysyltransferase, partial [Salmonella enterica subsp. enterica serovar Enteritidis]|nr:elongation factor P lysine(34) lysyltransferase [Salmonella enterica subsp. enterica serovar Enteritidis]